MLINGYEVDMVNDEEWKLYKSIRHRLNAEWIAGAIPHFDHEGRDLTQAEFERLVCLFEQEKLGYDEDSDDCCLAWAFDDIIGERSRA